MKFVCILVSALTLCLFHVTHAEVDTARRDSLLSNIPASIVQEEPVQRAIEIVEENGGCNRNVCFAIDGSSSVGAAAFEQQKFFVQTLLAIIGSDPDAQFAAVQYGFINSWISELTNNAGSVTLAVGDEEYLNADNTFVSAGLAFCVVQLSDPSVEGDVNKIVLLGDGGVNFGAQGNLDPVTIANFFRSQATVDGGNEVCAVGVNMDSLAPLEAIVGSADMVFDVATGFFDLLNFTDDLIEQICVDEERR